MKPGESTKNSKLRHGLLGAAALAALLALPLKAGDTGAGGIGEREPSLWQTLVDALDQLLPGEEEDPEGGVSIEPGG